MLFTIDQLKQLFPHFDGEHIGSEIAEVNTDSRKSTKNSLFIPIVGERFNAHEFIEQAVNEGAIATLWDKRYSVPTDLKNRCYIFYVDDTLQALQRLARHYREQINPIVIGITGSNGKTTVKDIVASLLETTYETHKTAGNFNNDIGLPLTILSMPQHTEVLVLEMGMSNFGEIELLSRIAEPDYAIITNIGESHIEYLGTREGIAKAKLEIVSGLKQSGTLIIDGDEQLLQSLSIEQSIVRCGFSKENTIVISEVGVVLNSTTFTVEGERYDLALTGVHHAKNATYAIVLAKKLGISKANIVQGLERIQYSDMRFEKTTHQSGAIIINDAYNASPTSVIAAVGVIKHLSEYEQKIVILGDVFELGERSEEFHIQIGESITEPIDIVLTLGNEAKLISDTVKKQQKSIVSEHFSDGASLIDKLQTYLNEKTIVLFKASRGMAFEKIIQKLID